MSGGVPAGWVLVPEYLTAEMLDAMEQTEHPNNHAAFYCDMWVNALAVRPAAPTSPSRDADVERVAIARALYLRRNPSDYSCNDMYRWQLAQSHAAGLAEYYADADAVRAVLDRLPPAIGDIEWLSGQRRLSLDFYSPMYCDDDDQSEEWRITQESGPINDREWDVIGRGQTIFEAVASARAALQALGER